MSNLFQNGQTTIHTYLSGPEGLFAVVVQEPKGTAYIRYIHTDHLGSWNTISDAAGNRLQETNFDAWGNRRDPNTWRAFASTPPEPLFDRGFTGHEHLYGFNLINMNGRVYDPVVSRMLSPDNFVQAPDFSQSFNRYSYAWNNPLVLTDPSGEIVGFLIAGAIIGAYIGGAYAEGDLNPGNWAWNNNTWKGIIAGGLIGTATGGVIGAMWSAGATISIGANLFGNSVPLISFSQTGFSTANTVAGLIGIGGLGAAGVASIDYSSLNTNKALNEMQSREDLYNQSIASWNSSIYKAIDLTSEGGPGWEAYAGAAASVASEMYYSETYGTWMGKNFKMYQQTWGGNGVTGGKYKFGKTTSNAIKWGGRALGAWNAYSIQRTYAAGEMGTGWMMAEQSTNTVSTFGGIYGAAWGVGWELGRAITTIEAYHEFKFNFWYNRMENAIGSPSPTNEGAWYDFFNNYGR